MLRAAYRLLKKRGIASVSAQELARQAGVSTATLYRWWKSKEAVMLDAFLARVKPMGLIRFRRHSTYAAFSTHSKIISTLSGVA